jgi:hypothetical protein
MDISIAGLRTDVNYIKYLFSSQETPRKNFLQPLYVSNVRLIQLKFAYADIHLEDGLHPLTYYCSKVRNLSKNELCFVETVVQGNELRRPKYQVNILTGFRYFAAVVIFIKNMAEEQAHC